MTKTLTEAQKAARLYKLFRDLEKQTPQDKKVQKKNKGGSVKRSKKK